VQELSHGLSINILNKTFTIHEIINLIEACGKNSVKETKRIYENLQDALLSKIKTLTSKNLSDILYAIAKYNLTEEYETNPFYIQFLLNFNEKTLKELENQIPQVAWTLSCFALKIKEFNPILHSVLLRFPSFLERTENLSTQDLKDILQSLIVAELMMKYNLTNIDLRETFNAELISSILSLYINRIQTDPNLNLIYLQEIFADSDQVKLAYTNLYSGIMLNYKDKTLPLILLDGNSLNMDGKLKGEDFITYYHLKSYCSTNPPMIIDVNKVNDRFEFEAEYQKYSKHPQTLYKKMLD
jgi:hypothetical protein